MKIEAHRLYRLGQRGHIALVLSVDTTARGMAVYRVVKSSDSVKVDATGREKKITLRHLGRQLEKGGAVHLCPRCYPEEEMRRTLWLFSSGEKVLEGVAECPLCGGAGFVGFAQTEIALGASSFRLVQVDQQAGTATVIDQESNRYLPSWVPGMQWTTRDWARLVDTAQHGAPAPTTPVSGLLEARLHAIRDTVAGASAMPLAAIPVLTRIGAIASGQLDRELAAGVGA